MKIGCVSDLHGYLPPVPDGLDLLLIGGDIGPHPTHDFEHQKRWLSTRFRRWLEPIVARCPVVGVAGNHDWIWERDPACVPADLPWTYLQDSGTTLAGLNIYGTPWQPRFCDWAFNADESDLRQRWAEIPDATDILILHGPPLGVGDLSPYGNVHTGSPSLTHRIMEIVPRLVVFGHIHSGRGVYRMGPTIAVNAAIVGEDYRPAGQMIVVDL